MSICVKQNIIYSGQSIWQKYAPLELSSDIVTRVKCEELLLGDYSGAACFNSQYGGVCFVTESHAGVQTGSNRDPKQESGP